MFKSAVFALGNAVYHNDTLFEFVEKILDNFIDLLNDPLAKTRIHCTGIFFNINFIEYKFFCLNCKILAQMYAF
jgi:hypothetical protein